MHAFMQARQGTGPNTHEAGGNFGAILCCCGCCPLGELIRGDYNVDKFKSIIRLMWCRFPLYTLFLKLKYFTFT